ncbi:hypothetical protein CWE09_08305 [Aliidiomarina minuta]|uniref:MSHA biogenesis protein MshJ n=1 Tax=Aliidiomarina minuta TaxID=880057 RepID=A0A432WAS2_9GAMM|nr:hypothetical protein [Aliidiomarina minuta]RUO26688.1 hypothetical protein CWE09_08305 [Aliidiomarina minuta]
MKIWEQANNWFSARERREKILLGLAVLLVIWLSVLHFSISPAQLRVEQKQQQVQRSSGELSMLSEEINQLETLLQRDPNAELYQREAELEARQVRLEERMSRSARIMTSGASVGWLQALLEENENIQITHFDTLQAEPVLGVSEREGLESEAGSMNLYQHHVELTLVGEYHAIRDYVERIQGLPYNYYWKTLKYEVADYPRAQITITLYALSTSKEFIGV